MINSVNSKGTVLRGAQRPGVRGACAPRGTPTSCRATTALKTNRSTPQARRNEIAGWDARPDTSARPPLTKPCDHFVLSPFYFNLVSNHPRYKEPRNPTRSSIGGPPPLSAAWSLASSRSSFGNDRYSRSLSLSVALFDGFLAFDGVVFRVLVLMAGRFLDSNAAWSLSLPFALGRGLLAFHLSCFGSYGGSWIKMLLDL